MKSKQVMAVLLAASLMTGLLAGCGESKSTDSTDAAAETTADATTDTKEEEQETEEATGEIEINFPCIWVGSDSKAEVFGKIVESFNAEYEGIYQVNIQEEADYDAYEARLRQEITDGAAPDIFTVKTQADVDYYTASGKVADLTEFLSGDVAENFVEGALEEAQVDGVSYAIPYEMAYVPIMYNGDMFLNNFIEVPTTFEELWEVCDTLQEAGITPLCQMTGGGNAWTSMLWYTYALAATGGENVFDLPYTDEAYVKAAELLKKMYTYTNDDAIGATASDVNAHFFAGDDAIYTNGTWILGRIDSDEATYPYLYDELTMGSGLSLDGANGNGFISYCQAYLMVGVQEDEAKMEAIESFISFITDPESILELANDSGSLFAVNINALALANEKAADAYNLAQNADFILPSFESQASTSVQAAFPGLVEQLVNDEITPEEFAQGLADAE